MNQAVDELQTVDARHREIILAQAVGEFLTHDPETWQTLLLGYAEQLDESPAAVDADIRGRLIARARKLQGNGEDAVFPKIRLTSARDLTTNIQPPDWLVRSYLEANTLALMFGDHSTYKSTLVIDQGCCIATGTPWHGYKVKQGAVVFIVGEGHSGIARRLKAWELRNGTSLAKAPLFVTATTVNLLKEAEAAALQDAIHETRCEPVYIVIDTLSRCAPGAEASNEDAMQFVAHCDRYLRSPFGAAVQIVHHTGHMEKDRPRGPSAIEAAMDASMRMEKTGESMVGLIPRKLKDAPLPAARYFRPVIQELGIRDEDGQEMTAAVLHAEDDYTPPKQTSAGLGREQRKLLDLLAELEATHRERVEQSGRDPSEAKVSVDVWKTEAFERKIVRDRRRFHDRKKTLIDRGLVRVDGLFVESVNQETDRHK